MTLPIKQRVKLACGVNGVTMSSVAAAMGMIPSSFSQKLDRDKFTKAELVKIAEIIGCKYDCYFSFDDGSVFRASTIGQQIKDALEHAEMSMNDLAVKMGLTRQAVSNRLATGKLSQNELETIAGYMGCEYVSAFELKDGTKI